MKGITNSSSGPRLLWTNSSPSSRFAAQTITLTNSASAYTFIAIDAKYNRSESYHELHIFKKGDTDIYLEDGDYYRDITSINDTSVTFDVGYDGSTESSSVLIPINIYGLI